MTINVSPLANTPYDSIWDGIAGQLMYFPSHFLADPSLTDELLDSNSTITGVSTVPLAAGTPAGTGANSGWFTGVASADVRGYSTDADLLTFFRTDTLAINEQLLFSFSLFLPAGGVPVGMSVLSYGKGTATQPGILINAATSDKFFLNFSDTSALLSAGTPVLDANAESQLFFVLTKTSSTDVALDTYVNGTFSATATAAMDPLTSITGGLSIYSAQNNAGALASPLGVDCQVRDIIIARTSGDQTSKIAGLALSQAGARTSLGMAWSDVL